MKRIISIFEILLCLEILIDVKPAWAVLTLNGTPLNEDQIAMLQQDAFGKLKKAQEALVEYEKNLTPGIQPLKNYHTPPYNSHYSDLIRAQKRYQIHRESCQEALKIRTEKRKTVDSDLHLKTIEQQIAIYNEFLNTLEATLETNIKRLNSERARAEITRDRHQELHNKYLAIRTTYLNNPNATDRESRLKDSDEWIARFKKSVKDMGERIANYDKRIKDYHEQMQNERKEAIKMRDKYLVDRDKYLADRTKDLAAFDWRITLYNERIADCQKSLCAGEKKLKLLNERMVLEKQIEDARKELNTALSDYLYLNELQWTANPSIATVKKFTAQIVTEKSDADIMSIDKSSIDKRMPLMPIQSGNKVSTQYTQRNKVLIYAMMYLQEHLKKLAPEFEKKWAKTVGPELAKKWVMRWAQTLTRQLPLEIAEEEEAWTRQLILEPKTEIAKSEQKFNQAEAQAAIKKRIWARIKKHAQFAIEAMAQKWAENREELWAQEWKSEMEPALSTGHSANTTCSR